MTLSKSTIIVLFHWIYAKHTYHCRIFLLTKYHFWKCTPLQCKFINTLDQLKHQLCGYFLSQSLTMNNIFKIMHWTRSLTHFRSTNIYSCKISNFSKDPDGGTWQSMEGLLHCSANSVPLSPINFLERAAKVCRDRTSVVYGSFKYNWAQTHQRCLKLASALTQLGVSRGDVVSNFDKIITTHMLLVL
jgi:hypothetical protein